MKNRFAGLLIIAMGLVILSGCASGVDPRTGETMAQSMAKGAKKGLMDSVPSAQKAVRSIGRSAGRRL